MLFLKYKCFSLSLSVCVCVRVFVCMYVYIYTVNTLEFKSKEFEGKHTSFGLVKALIQLPIKREKRKMENEVKEKGRENESRRISLKRTFSSSGFVKERGIHLACLRLLLGLCLNL